MTQLHLAILMHCNGINEPYGLHNPQHGLSPATLEYTEQLQDRGLIIRALRDNNGGDQRFRQYITTDKGRRFCGRILDYASSGAPPRGRIPVPKEPRLRDDHTFVQFFGGLRFPGWLWLGIAVLALWR